VDVLIQRSVLYAASYRIREDIVCEGQWTRNIRDAVDLRQTVDYRLTDVRTVVRRISFLAAVAKTKAEFVQNARRNSGHERRGVCRRIADRRSRDAAGPRRQLRIRPDVLTADCQKEFILRVEIVIHPEIQLITVHLDCPGKRGLRTALPLSKLIVRNIQTVAG